MVSWLESGPPNKKRVHSCVRILNPTSGSGSHRLVLKDKTEGRDVQYPFIKQGCNRLQHVWRWLYVLCYMHNEMSDRIGFNGQLNLMEVVA